MQENTGSLAVSFLLFGDSFVTILEEAAAWAKVKGRRGFEYRIVYMGGRQMKADFHLHCCFSGDSDALPEEIVETGIQRGLSALCFTDHYDAEYPYEDVCFELNTEAYVSRIAGLRDIFKGQIFVGIGVELGLQPQLGPLYRSYVARYPFDFVIGSTHLVDGMDPYYGSFWEKHTPGGGIRRFLEVTLENIHGFDEFDVYGHLDYIVRYVPEGMGRFSMKEHGDLVDEILRTLIARGKGIEVNTGGYRAGLGAPNPCQAVLQRYRELGGEIVTLGSDAHLVKDVGKSIEKAQEVLRVCGFRYFALFRGRRPEFVALD